MFNLEYNGRKAEYPSIFPRRPGSIYHCSKVASTYLIDFCARTWGLKCTDIMQSVVFGSYTDEISETKIHTRLDSDDCFGTAVNRFVTQAALGVPLTVYGKGEHLRGFISLNDSIQALELAVNNPVKNGEVQTWNQLSFWASMNDLAEMVKKCGNEMGMSVEISHVETPRTEKTEKHYYRYETEKLKNLGYLPTRTLDEEIKDTLSLIRRNLTKSMKDTLLQVVMPRVQWR
jgi:nucleoside-diphosphate-sugar epimerase